jgi:xanthine dehydrogenase large subunit
MYGIGAYFALRNAIKAFNPSADIPFDAPMTPEGVDELYPQSIIQATRKSKKRSEK